MAVSFDRKTVEILRSDRKTVAVEITPDLQILVRAPKRMKKGDVERFIDEKTPWIEAHLAKMESRRAARRESGDKPFSKEEIAALTALAKRELPRQVETLSRLVGVSYGNITVRHQISRWGSCSSKGNLNFNCLLMLCPEAVRDYIILHELCHRREMNHSRSFWSEVERFCPDYREMREWLKNDGSALIQRLRG